MSDEEFLQLLEKTKLLVLEGLGDIDVAKLDGGSFEELVFESVVSAAEGTSFAGEVEHTGAQSFPDIVVANIYGVEVKATKADHWTSIGNSVSESTRVLDLEKVYLFFGKLGGSPELKVRVYEESLKGILVTHNPRYSIDMNLPSGQSIFDKMGVPYEELRRQVRPVQTIKDYLRSTLKAGEELWWLENTVSPIIQSFKDLSRADQEQFLCEAHFLFPEIYGSSNRKYERLPAYLLNKHNAVSSNLRDKFSSKGRERVVIGRVEVLVPRVLFNLKKRAPGVKRALLEAEKKLLIDSWGVSEVSSDRVEQFKSLINSACGWSEAGLSASDIFEVGLEKN